MIAAAFLSLYALFASAGVSHAIETETFRLQPHPLRIEGYERRSFDFDVQPGTVVTDAVKITNTTDQPRRFRLAATDAQRDPNTGRLAVGSRGVEPKGMGKWISLERVELELPPRASEVVEFRFERPEGQDVAGFGAIVAEEIRDVEGAGVDVVYRLALVVQLGGRTPDIKVTEPELDVPLGMVPSDATMTSTITNETLGSVDATVRFSATSLTGRTWLLEPEEITLEPGETADVGGAWGTVPRWGGILQPHVEVVWQRGSVVLSGDRSLYPPLWLLALVILAVGVRGLREMWSRREEGREQRGDPAPDPDVLRGRLIEAALWLHAAGRDAPAELRETTVAESRAVAARAKHTKGAEDVERAARSLEAFARAIESDDGSARRAASDFDAWIREHRDDPRVKQLVGS